MDKGMMVVAIATGVTGVILSRVVWNAMMGKKIKEQEEALEEELKRNAEKMVKEAFPAPEFIDRELFRRVK